MVARAPGVGARSSSAGCGSASRAPPGSSTSWSARGSSGRRRASKPREVLVQPTTSTKSTPPERPRRRRGARRSCPDSIATMPSIERLVFFGTPEFAVPSLEALVAAGRPPVLVVTQPPRPAGRGRRLLEPPVAVRARELGLAVRFSRSGCEAPEFLAELDSDRARSRRRRRLRADLSARAARAAAARLRQRARFAAAALARRGADPCRDRGGGRAHRRLGAADGGGARQRTGPTRERAVEIGAEETAGELARAARATRRRAAGRDRRRARGGRRRPARSRAAGAPTRPSCAGARWRSTSRGPRRSWPGACAPRRPSRARRSRPAASGCKLLAASSSLRRERQGRRRGGVLGVDGRGAARRRGRGSVLGLVRVQRPGGRPISGRDYANGARLARRHRSWRERIPVSRRPAPPSVPDRPAGRRPIRAVPAPTAARRRGWSTTHARLARASGAPSRARRSASTSATGGCSRELVYGTLRWLRRLDHVIERASAALDRGDRRAGAASPSCGWPRCSSCSSTGCRRTPRSPRRSTRRRRAATAAAPVSSTRCCAGSRASRGSTTGRSTRPIRCAAWRSRRATPTPWSARWWRPVRRGGDARGCSTPTTAERPLHLLAFRDRGGREALRRGSRRRRDRDGAEPRSRRSV